MNFEQTGLIQPILKAVQRQGYTHPTPIQQKSIPIVLAKKDLLGCAQTGTGKTAAFAIPIMQLMHEKPTTTNHIRTLVLTPTRELAIQIYDSFVTYGKYLDLRHMVVFGGVSQSIQTELLKKGTDVLVATPGRLLDLIGQGYIMINRVEFFVLDEADRMLDMGFLRDVKKIIDYLPERRQTLFFSATMPPQIAELASQILVDAERVDVAPVSSTSENVEQTIFMVEKKNKQQLLEHLLKENNIERTLVFTRTKHGADRIAKNLKRSQILADAIHGDKSQTARQKALSNFKSGSLKVLVATDIAARGIDISNLTHVINYDLPDVPETYVHRIGRTGRAGSGGIAFSFCDADEKINLRDISKLTRQDIPVNAAHPFHVTFSDKRSINVSAKKQTSNRFNRHHEQQRNTKIPR